jgi:hypothetical protein
MWGTAWDVEAQAPADLDDLDARPGSACLSRRLREAIEMDVAHQSAHLALSRLYLVTGRDDHGVRHAVVAADLFRGFRPSYLAAEARSGSGEHLVLGRELLPIEDMRELVDVHVLLQQEPGEAHTYGLRGQVEEME